MPEQLGASSAPAPVGSPLAALSRRTNSFFELALHEGNALALRKASKNNPRTKLCVSIIEDFRGIYMPELQSTSFVK
ncbi:hypothetical protein BN1002_04302 [Bacillus sp. B-jedd]|nr:hypothetical protein BN1002_04302 [Bacillus sp. B-jedd]